MSAAHTSQTERVEALLDAGRGEEAVAILRSQVSPNPADVEPRWALADLLRRLERRGEAVAAYQSLVGAYLVSGRPLKALFVCKLIQALDPTHRETHAALADVFAARPFGETATVEVPEALCADQALTGSGSGRRGQLHIARLAEVPLFSDLPRHGFVSLVQRMQLRVAESGVTLAREGELADSMLVVVDGRIRVVRQEAGVMRTGSMLDEGAFHGESALVVRAPRTATLVCDSRVSMFEISAELVSELSRHDVDIRDAFRRFQKSRLVVPLPRAAVPAVVSFQAPAVGSLALAERTSIAAPSSPSAVVDAVQIGRARTRRGIPLVPLLVAVALLVAAAAGSSSVIRRMERALPSLETQKSDVVGGATVASPTMDDAIDSLLGRGAAARAQTTAPPSRSMAAGVSVTDSGELRATPEAMRRLEDHAALHVEDGDAQAAVALQLSDRDPVRALALVERPEAVKTTLGTIAEARALDTLGRSNEATELLTRRRGAIVASVGVSDGGGQFNEDLALDHTLLELRSRGGRCRDNLALARHLGQDGGVAGALAWIRYQTLCLGDAAAAERTAKALLALPRMTSVNRARVAGELALVRLFRVDVEGAREACKQMDAFDPGRAETSHVAARCSLINGVFCRDAWSAAASDAEELCTGAGLLRDGAQLPPELGARTWRRGGALLRAVAALRSHQQRAVVEEARGALLAPRREEIAEFPPTLPELLAVVTLVPPESVPLAVALARAIVGDTTDLSGAGIWEPVLTSAVQWARALEEGKVPAAAAPATKTAWAGIPPGKLTSFLLAPPDRWSTWAQDAHLGPAVLLAMSRQGQPSPELVEKWRTRAPRHPWLAAWASN